MSAQIRKIAVPTDFSDLSERAITYAASMARGSGASLYLIHVLESKEHYDEARARLTALADRFTEGITRVTTEVRDGEPADSIADAALHYGADLVVIATHARTGLAHLLSGSVAERLIRIAWCPVLVLRETGTVRVHRRATEAAARMEGVA